MVPGQQCPTALTRYLSVEQQNQTMRFFLNTVDIFSKEELVRYGFVQAAAPSTTDAYHINRNAVHSVLYLPVGTSKCLPLHDERLKEIQETFSMTGQKTFTMVSKRLQETRPHYKDKSSHLGIFRWSSWGTSSSCHQSAILLYDNAITLNLCDSNEKTDQTPGPS